MTYHGYGIQREDGDLASIHGTSQEGQKCLLRGPAIFRTRTEAERERLSQP